MTFVVENLLERVQGRPVRHIEKNGAPYLSRYFLAKHPDGRQLWLHRFHSAGGDDMLHNHAWWARSWVITGQYSEQYVAEDGVRVRRRQAPIGAVPQAQLLPSIEAALGGVNRWGPTLDEIRGGELVTQGRWHRVLWIEPETWTALVVEPGRDRYWHFLDPCGHPGTPRIAPPGAALHAPQLHAVPGALLVPDGWTRRSVKTEGEDWFKKYCPCGGEGCAICDV